MSMKFPLRTHFTHHQFHGSFLDFTQIPPVLIGLSVASSCRILGYFIVAWVWVKGSASQKVVLLIIIALHLVPLSILLFPLRNFPPPLVESAQMISLPPLHTRIRHPRFTKPFFEFRFPHDSSWNLDQC